MIELLDVNILISLAWPNHVHHRAALTWFNRRAGSPWATTAVTELGFVRLSANPSAVSAAATPSEAVRLLQRICQVPGHKFLVDDLSLAVPNGGMSRVVTHRHATDGHLLALARRHGGRLVTFDRGIPPLAENPEDVYLVAF